jgi:hypothetical protein
MTTKPRSRKPSTKTATPAEFASLPYDGMTASIPKLIACLRFIAADCRSDAAICDPGPNARHAALNVRRREERDEILRRLAEVVPDCLDDAMALLEFAA